MTPLSAQQIAELLNQLLEAEWQSLLRRIAEASPYVPPDQARLGELLKGMADHQRQHFTDLAQMIIELDGTPTPLRCDMHRTQDGYLRLNYILPNLCTDLQHLLERYRAAADQLPPDTAPGQLLRRIRQCWQEHLDTLQFHARQSPDRS